MPFDAAKLAKLQAQAGSSRIGASLPVIFLASKSMHCFCVFAVLGFSMLLTIFAFYSISAVVTSQ
jgi:hypothetical protein